MAKHIIHELKEHAPFTLFGAFTGIIIIMLMNFCKMPAKTCSIIFYIFHPIHVLLSALVTTAMFKLHKGKLLPAIIIGYVGSIGIATLSDIIFPYLGGVLLGIEMHFHLGFIEKWWLVNPLAILGIFIGLWRPTTKIPHSGHVLLSTWASLFYIIAFGTANWINLLFPIFIILFIAVWIPCCVSDIVFPLLFVKE
jgi:hypothetical protein